MVNNVEKHSEVVSSNLAEIGESTKEAGNKVMYFGKNDIHMDDEVSEIPERVHSIYKDTLSSTPSAHLIIEAIEINRMDTEDAYSY